MHSMVLIIMIILLVPFLSVAHLGRFAASWRSLNCLSASWSIGISSDGYDLFVLSEFLLATLILEPGVCIMLWLININVVFLLYSLISESISMVHRTRLCCRSHMYGHDMHIWKHLSVLCN